MKHNSRITHRGPSQTTAVQSGVSGRHCPMDSRLVWVDCFVHAFMRSCVPAFMRISQMLRKVAIHAIRLSALSSVGEVVHDAPDRAVFGFRRNCFIRGIPRGVSGVVGCLHMSVGLKIESGGKSGESYVCVIAYE